MSEEKTIYNIDTAGEKIEGFLDAVLDTMDLDVTYEFFDGEETKAYFEGPSLVVKFEGAEIEHLLQRAGFAVEVIYGSYDLDDFSSDSDKMITVARRLD